MDDDDDSTPVLSLATSPSEEDDTPIIDPYGLIDHTDEPPEPLNPSLLADDESLTSQHLEAPSLASPPTSSVAEDTAAFANTAVDKPAPSSGPSKGGLFDDLTFDFNSSSSQETQNGAAPVKAEKPEKFSFEGLADQLPKVGESPKTTPEEASEQPAPPPPPQPTPAPPSGAPALKRIGDILIEMGMISAKQLEQALSESKALGVPLGTTLLRLGWANEVQLGQALAYQHGLPYINSKDVDLRREFMSLLPDQMIRKKFVIPFGIKGTRLSVIVSYPTNKLLDEIASITGYRVSPHIMAHNEMIRLIETYFSSGVSTEDAVARMEAELEEKRQEIASGNQDNIEDEIEHADSGAVSLVNAILIRSIDLNASDIHIESQKERVLIRVRVDGVLKELDSFPKLMADPIISRIKITSGMDIAERRRPQDGRLKIKHAGAEIDMRVNTLPCRYGEKVCLRILKATATTGGLEKLGLSVNEFGRIEKMIRSPNGMVLVTGPTGSGKTTTLYSFLREIQSSEINITTVEDPIEYPLAGVNQTQVSHKSGLDFAVCLRAILRQDPDVVMVGEIRDHETLEVSLHAALTGHLVFSTLHTNSTAKTINRLLDMGAPPYQISTAINGILAQRLVRTICPNCREPYEASPRELEILKMPPNVKANLYKGAGCDRCENTGYKGRVGLYEIMLVTRELQELIDQKASAHIVQEMAIKQGMKTLAMDGRDKALKGQTTFNEVTRVLGIELDIPDFVQPELPPAS